MKRILLPVQIGFYIFLLGCGPSIQQKGDTARGKDAPVLALCQASGLLKLEKRSTLHFTFNVRLPGKTVTRSWMWDIKHDIVQLNGTSVRPDDQRFVNDKYWLLFPLMAYYDRSHTRVSMNMKSLSPISHQECIEVTIAYVDGGGYTPNDVYKLYCKDDMRIFEWAYYKAGQKPPERVTRWNGYTEFKGIDLSLDRPSAGDFRVWFSDVRIE